MPHTPQNVIFHSKLGHKRLLVRDIFIIAKKGGRRYYQHDDR
jgi:hypothetical protein